MEIFFFDAELEKLGGQTVLRGNLGLACVAWRFCRAGRRSGVATLDIKDTKKLANNLSPFLKEFIEILSELNYQGSIETVEPFLTQNLW